MPNEDEIEAELLDDVLGQVPESPGLEGLPSLSEDDLRRLSWDRFEALAAALWEKQGNQVILTPKSGDEGVDVIAVRETNVHLLQCKHTLWDAWVDADAVAELIQAFDGYRAKRFLGHHGKLTLRSTLITNGKLTRQAKRTAMERDVTACGVEELLGLLAAHPCTAADVEAANARRLQSMRDVQARIAQLIHLSG